jgi:hypothetical protein
MSYGRWQVVGTTFQRPQDLEMLKTFSQIYPFFSINIAQVKFVKATLSKSFFSFDFVKEKKGL